ncbi:MAG TPA: sialate O-acetylesterase [Labilithrix sp.]|nr:sialate O-acetylesterase [Labilithrix sp.]
MAEPTAPSATTAPSRRDINHVLITGQSLAVGVSGAPPLSLTQPFGNLMFNTGVMAGANELERFEPLVEGDTIPGSKAVVETMSSGFANLVAERARADGGNVHDLLVSVSASGAKPYSRLKKGTKPYDDALAQVVAGRDISQKMGKSYAVLAVLNVHGESDHAEKKTDYLQNLLEWQADYERDVRALTGQREPVPMFHTQISSWTRLMKGTETSAIPGAQLAAHVESGGKIVLVGPKYHLSYSKDGVHLTSEGYRHMGEDYAKAYHRVVVEGKRWEPLRPIAITREGERITVKFAVPVPPLVLDTELVSDPGDYGFEYSDASASSPRITRVEVTAPDTVVVTLSAVPTADDRHLRYAFTGTRGARSGPQTGARGNLRDSDATPSRSGQRLYNWCVHFDQPVP